MVNKELRLLFGLIKRLDDTVLYEIATVPSVLLPSFTDRAIVAVAKGEREWRNGR